jgi:hypothetical protein
MAYGQVNADVIGTSVAGSNLGAGDASLLKNRLINGSMVIDQRNAGASISGTGGGKYATDRWRCDLDSTPTIAIQQSTTAPTGFSNSWYGNITGAATVTSGQANVLLQKIEGYNTADLMYGTADAKTTTLSFWVRSSVTGTYGGNYQNQAGNRTYVFQYTISAANTWEYKSVTIAGDTSGTWIGATNGSGLIVNFDLGSGTSYEASANAWNASFKCRSSGNVSLCSLSAATFYITGVQLEVGSSATGYEYRQYTTELQLCQRYCFLLTSVGGSGSYIRWATGENNGTTGNNTPIMFPTTMRTSATLTTTGTASNYGLSSNASGISATAISTQSNACTNQTHAISVSVASGLISGGCSTLISNNNNTAYLLFTAEL